MGINLHERISVLYRDRGTHCGSSFPPVSAKLATVNEPLAYSIEVAAEKLSLSRSTLKTMIREREIVVVRRGTRVLIPRQSMEDWLERNST
jgi:excisionase family DNA binding protein